MALYHHGSVQLLNMRQILQKLQLKLLECSHPSILVHAHKLGQFVDTIWWLLPQSSNAVSSFVLQLVGMTATIGIGDSSNLEQATDFIMDMCAKFNLKSPPIEPEDLNQLSNRPVERMLKLVKR